MMRAKERTAWRAHQAPRRESARLAQATFFTGGADDDGGR